MKRFEAQRSRGTTSFGFFDPEQNKMVHHVKEGRIKKLLQRQKRTEVLFHHRLSTSTVDVRNACHPFSTKNYFENQYIVIHNGMISNHGELKRQHEELGIKYVSTQPNGTYNDSEALAYDLARYFEGRVDKLTATGSIAFIAIKMVDGKKVQLLFGHNSGNPLVMKRTKNSITISSTGEGEPVKENILNIYDYETGELREVEMIIPRYSVYTGSSTSTQTKQLGFQTNKSYSTTRLRYRGKDKDEIYSNLMVSSEGDLKGASDRAYQEAKTADVVMKDIEKRAMNPSTSSEVVDKLFDEHEAVGSHKSKMEEIAMDFYLLFMEYEEKKEEYLEWKNLPA